MFGFLRRKKNKDAEEEVLSAEEKKHKDLEATLQEELEKEKKREEKKKEKGPNWISLLVMFVSLLSAIFFWLYGRVAEMGLAGLVPDFSSNTTSRSTENETSPTPRPKIQNQDGLIIFEKED